MGRRTLGLATVGLLAALGVLFFRVGPDGDVWDAAEQLGINPWIFVLLILVGAVVWLAFRTGLLGLST